MTGLQVPASIRGELNLNAPEQGRRSLTRLRWVLRVAVLVGFGLLAFYDIFVVHRSIRESLLSFSWGALLGLGLIQICFSIVLRLYDQAATHGQKTQQTMAEAAALAEISRAVSSKRTQNDLLPYLAENLARILDGTGCYIALRHPLTGDMQPAATFGAYEGEGRSLLMTKGFTSLARALMDAGQPIVIEDVTDDAHIAPQKTEHPLDKSLLGLPMVVKGEVIGAAIIGDTRQQRRFSLDQIGRAMIVANHGAVAIANARLFQETERRLVELGTLAEISRVLYSPLHSHDIYQRTVEELARAFGYPFVAFYQAQGDGLKLAAQIGYGKEGPSAYIPLGRGLIGDAAATGEIGYVLDSTVRTDHGTATEGVVSQIVIPLRKDEQVLGVLSVESHDPLTEVDLSLLQAVSYQVNTALENARLYAAEQREREVTQALLQIAGDLSGTLHLDEVLNLVLERLRAVVPYESAAIGLLVGDACYIAAAHDLPRARRLWGTRIFPDDLPLVGRVLRERRVVIVDETHQSDDWVVVEGGENIHSWLGVPLEVQDRAIGLLMLNHVEPGFYGQDAARVALACAQHASLAIDNARLYEQTQTSLREQKLLHEMTTAVSSTLEAGQVLRLLAEHLVTVLGITSVCIATLDDEAGIANLVAEHWGAGADEYERASRVGESYELDAFPVTAEKLVQREPLLITAGNGPAEWHETITQRSGQAMLLLPLVARDRVTGFVELWDSRSRRSFTEAEITLAQTLINPAAVAIDNAHLFAETQRSISETMLLYDIAVSAAYTLELETILQSVVKTIQFRVLEKSAVNVWLLDVSEDVLRLRAHAGDLLGIPGKETLQIDEGLCGQVVQTGQPILIADSRHDPNGADYGPAVRSILCVPLAWGQRVVGVLQALSAQENAYSKHDLRLLRTMAGNLAVAIENVRLFNQLKRSEEALVLRNQALERANDRLQELDRLKSAFIASVSHELRTPLNSIIGFSEVILDGLAGALEPLAHEYLGYIHDSGRHLLNLINDILDLSRIQAGRMALTLETVDVMAVLEEVRTTLAPLIAKKEQTFAVEPEGPLTNIVADRFRLKQVLLNVLSNANKYTQDGGRITVRALLADATTMRLDVIDNGLGISLEDQNVIFEEFRQARATRPGEGTGMGLAITRRLVELHGGRFWVESELGHGATFTILFPIAGPEPDKIDQTDAAEGRMG